MVKPARAKKLPSAVAPDVLPHIDAMPKVPAAAVFSFLKGMRGALTWTARELMETLNVSQPDVDKILTILKLQGYVSETGDNEWLTTASGETVSGSKPPRFTRQGVDGALSTLFDRIAAINKDANAEFKITEAVAFGDFLTGRANCQAADVGIELTRREVSGDSEPGDFLKQLRGKSLFFHVQPYEEWMSKRLHRRLL